MTESAAADENGKSVRRVKLGEFEENGSAGNALFAGNMDLIRNVKVRLTVSVGHCEVSVKDLFALKENSVLTLDRKTREPIEIMLDGKVVARGTLVAVDDSFGIRISEIAGS
jgi:flagellar motor switch protein FliN/FliY